MGESAGTGVVEDGRFLDHRVPGGHPERPERLGAVGRAIAARADRIERLALRAADDAELLRVHRAAHLATVVDAAAAAPTQLDPDTHVSERSAGVARLAAGGAVDLARAVARGELANGFAAVRPPGHHAEAAHAMGFCLFNNVAVAAEALRADEGVERILILDWDVHHGNGTQHSFDAERDVLYLSTHQWPYYPGTGAVSEAGSGTGLGATVNVPLPAGCGDVEYLAALQRVLVPVARTFRPEIILVSTGFDAHRDDPLSAMGVSAAGYLALARLVASLARDLCGGRLVHVLEGGYALSGLEQGTAAVLDSLLVPAEPPPSAELDPAGPVAAVLEQLVAVHGARYPGLGAV